MGRASLGRLEAMLGPSWGQVAAMWRRTDRACGRQPIVPNVAFWTAQKLASNLQFACLPALPASNLLRVRLAACNCFIVFFFCFFLACFLLVQLAPAPSFFCLLLLASSFLLFSSSSSVSSLLASCSCRLIAFSFSFSLNLLNFFAFASALWHLLRVWLAACNCSPLLSAGVSGYNYIIIYIYI